jgi:hypothetical protein
MQSAFFIAVTGHPKSPPSGSAPAQVDFPHGLLDFVLIGCTPGSTMSFTVVYPAPLPSGASYWKYGPTLANTAAHWYVLPSAVAGNTATFAVIDGGLGDDDLAANGTVVDQGGPGVPGGGGGGGVNAVPTLSETMLALLAFLLFASAVRGHSRRKE